MMIMNQKTNVIIVSSYSERYYVFGFIVFFNIWVIIGIGIALILEFVMSIYYCDNDPECYEILVRKDIIQDHVILLCNCCNQGIVRYRLLAICSFLGFGGYAFHIAGAINSANSCDRYSKSDGDVDTACKELRDLAIEFTLYAVSNKAIILLDIPGHINRYLVE